MNSAASTLIDQSVSVPFFRPEIGGQEIEEVVRTLESGWLTTGPRVARFEADFARAVGAKHAVALNSCTAALHLAVESLGLTAGHGVLVPTMTFAATAEVVRYVGAEPILVDCDPSTGNLDVHDASQRLDEARRKGISVVGIMPVHVGGLMADMDAVAQLARDNGLWIVEDGAHAMPAAWRRSAGAPWQDCGARTANVTCFSFYANKTLTTGEGGMAVTEDDGLAARMRLMSLHGLSHDAWGRYSGTGNWDYRIVAPGYKYNLTDIAAAIGIHQLARAGDMRDRRERLARAYRERLGGVDAIELPAPDDNRIHAWHLFQIQLVLERLDTGRDEILAELKQSGVTCSVHWRPLHLHPYYRETYGLWPEEYPAATARFARILSLPLFSCMTEDELTRVVDTLSRTVLRHLR